MNKQKFDVLMENPLSKIKSTRDALMRLYWAIVDRERITLQKWSQAVRNYVQDPANGVPPVANTRVEFRSNLRGALSRDTLSWKSFHRAIKAIGIKRAKMRFYYSFSEDEDVEYKYIEVPVLAVRKKRKKETPDGKESDKADSSRDGTPR